MSKKIAKNVTTTAVKRLMPTKDVLRELYLKSGNQCAFPGCNHLMMDSDGDFVGQICHIEAAEPGGQRFNPKQSNEDRRAIKQGNRELHDIIKALAIRQIAVTRTKKEPRNSYFHAYYEQKMAIARHSLNIRDINIRVYTHATAAQAYVTFTLCFLPLPTVSAGVLSVDCQTHPSIISLDFPPLISLCMVAIPLPRIYLH